MIAGPQGSPIIFSDLAAIVTDRTRRWEPFRKGIEISQIYKTPEGPSAAFLRYEPGASLGRHEHRGYEHILVLSGAQIDDSGEHRAGAMMVHPPGTTHAISSREGCVVLAIWGQPVSFLP